MSKEHAQDSEFRSFFERIEIRDLLTFNFWMEIESHPFISHFNIVRALVNLICQSEMTQMYKILLTQFAVCDSTAARRSRSNGPFQSLL